jgi:hypothetical protein
VGAGLAKGAPEITALGLNCDDAINDRANRGKAGVAARRSALDEGINDEAMKGFPSAVGTDPHLLRSRGKRASAVGAKRSQGAQLGRAQCPPPASVDAVGKGFSVDPSQDQVGNSRVDLMLIEHDPRFARHAEGRDRGLPQRCLHRALGRESVSSLHACPHEK